MAVRITTFFLSFLLVVFFLSFLLVVFFIARSMGLLAEWTVKWVNLQARLCAFCKPSRININAAAADSLEHRPV